MADGDFVKSAISTVSAEKTQGEIIAVLGRYGASGFGFRRRGNTVTATFHLPRPSGDDQTVQIPVDIDTVFARLTAFHKSPAGQRRKQAAPDMAQAERTAWRALLTWIEASLLAVQLGAQSMEEAFFAHLVIATDDGQVGRMIDYVQVLTDASTGRLPNPQRLALGSGAASPEGR